MSQGIQSRFLFDVVKRSIDLKGFVEREGNATLSQSGMNCWKGICPLHKDSKPSFTVTLHEDGVWVYHCFGCNSGGTVIDFCMELACIANPHEAAVYAAKREGIKCDESLITRAMREARITVDGQREIDVLHFVVCENCRMLLRMCGGDEDTMGWVASAYKAMDKLFDDPKATRDSFEAFRAESCRRLAALSAIGRR